MTKRIVGTILLASFIAIAVFGFVAMGEGHGSTHGSCIAATVQGVTRCQGLGDNAESLLFHVQTFQSFSQALITGMMALAMFSFFALFGFTRTAAETQSLLRQRFVAPTVVRAAQLWEKIRRRVIYWLALHESRDDHALTGA